MKKKSAIIVILTAITFFALSAVAFSQGPDTLSGPCEGRKGSSSIELLNGDIFNRPCEGRSSVFEKNVSFRRFNLDNYRYGFSFDSLSNYDGTGERTNSYTEFNLDTAPQAGVFRNGYTIFNITTPNNIAAAIGMTAHIVKTGTGSAHDLQALQGSTIVTDGRVSSGIYGMIGSVGVFGGSAHGDIADLSVGGSTISNTSARSYSSIWITRPTMTNTTFSGPVSAFRIDDGPRTPAFTINQSGQIRIVNPVTPVNAAAPCQTGEIVWDPDHVYVCVTTNSWKRTALTSW